MTVEEYRKMLLARMEAGVFPLPTTKVEYADQLGIAFQEGKVAGIQDAQKTMEEVWRGVKEAEKR